MIVTHVNNPSTADVLPAKVGKCCLCQVSEDQILPEHSRQDPGHQPQAAHASYQLLHSPVIVNELLEDIKKGCFPGFSSTANTAFLLSLPD